MAVTTEKSTQLTNIDATPPVMLQPHDDHGRMRMKYFSFTQGAAAGDAASFQQLQKLPPGRVRVFPRMSYIAWSAFGAARTLNIGYQAHTDDNGDAVAAAADTLDDGRDVSSAGGDYLGDGTNGVDTILFNSQDGVVIEATNIGGTIPAAATLEGWIAYMMD